MSCCKWALSKADHNVVAGASGHVSHAHFYARGVVARACSLLLTSRSNGCRVGVLCMTQCALERHEYDIRVCVRCVHHLKFVNNVLSVTFSIYVLRRTSYVRYTRIVNARASVPAVCGLWTLKMGTSLYGHSTYLLAYLDK